MHRLLVELGLRRPVDANTAFHRQIDSISKRLDRPGSRLWIEKQSSYLGAYVVKGFSDVETRGRNLVGYTITQTKVPIEMYVDFRTETKPVSDWVRYSTVIMRDILTGDAAIDKQILDYILFQNGISRGGAFGKLEGESDLIWYTSQPLKDFLSTGLEAEVLKHAYARFKYLPLFHDSRQQIVLGKNAEELFLEQTQERNQNLAHTLRNY